MAKRRRALERDWMTLTRERLPQAARLRDWPISEDHCFQRVLLDNACGGVWYDHIIGRPAYACAADRQLQTAIALGEAVLSGARDIALLNRQSLAWREARAAPTSPHR